MAGEETEQNGNQDRTRLKGEGKDVGCVLVIDEIVNKGINLLQDLKLWVAKGGNTTCMCQNGCYVGGCRK